LRFPDIQLDYSWNIDDLPWAVFSAPGKKKSYYDLVTSLDPDLVAAIDPHVSKVSPNLPEHIRRWHISSAHCFLYLFLSLGSQKSPPCVYTLRSTIPIGAGLGSSASISTCLAGALLLQIRALSGPHADQPLDESATQIERINRWAFVGELCIHGNPSGVDNTVSSGGKAVLFKRTDYAKPPLVTRLDNFPELPLLLVNTRQSRSTAVEVAKVGALRKVHPGIAEHILDAINDVTESAHSLLQRPDFDRRDPDNLKHLGELFTINHGLLVALGVSHPKLERIRELIDHAGAGWTKLTGAGGGGCAITILKPDDPQLAKSSTIGHHLNGNGASNQNANGASTPMLIQTSTKPRTIADTKAQLAAEGFETFETTLGGDGVGILWPAVLHNASGEEGGEEIDQEKFLRVQDNAGIEALVGVNAHHQVVKTPNGSVGEREGWKFWRTGE
jgi:mevalonate kinase